MQALEVESPSPPVRKRHQFTPETSLKANEARKVNAEARKLDTPTITIKSDALEAQYKFSKEDWAKLEHSLREDITKAIRTKSQKPSALRELVTCAGIAYDKAYKHLSEDIAQLRTPPIIVDRLLAMVSGDTAKPIGNHTIPEPNQQVIATEEVG